MAAAAASDQAEVSRLVRNALGVAEVDVSYPGFVAAAFAAQAARRNGSSSLDDGGKARLEILLRDAQASDLRARAGPCPAWRVDLPPYEAHLDESLARAKRQVPQRPDRAEALARVHVAAWQPGDRDAFCRSACVLAQVWPEMLAEMDVVVRQIALLEGFGIDGFTDFTAHGVVFVNRERLSTDRDGLPGEARLSEALVHEATHNRCNASAVAGPFLAADASQAGSLVMTPLRSDPRPLTGLFQQLVVLVRSVLLYDRLLERAGDHGPLRSRRQQLLAQSVQGLQTARSHLDKFTAKGQDAIAEATELVERAGRATVS